MKLIIRLLLALLGSFVFFIVSDSGSVSLLLLVLLAYFEITKESKKQKVFK